MRNLDIIIAKNRKAKPAKSRIIDRFCFHKDEFGAVHIFRQLPNHSEDSSKGWRRDRNMGVFATWAPCSKDWTFPFCTYMSPSGLEGTWYSLEDKIQMLTEMLFDVRLTLERRHPSGINPDKFPCLKSFEEYCLRQKSEYYRLLRREKDLEREWLAFKNSKMPDNLDEVKVDIEIEKLGGPTAKASNAKQVCNCNNRANWSSWCPGGQWQGSGTTYNNSKTAESDTQEYDWHEWRVRGTPVPDTPDYGVVQEGRLKGYQKVPYYEPYWKPSSKPDLRGLGLRSRHDE